MPQQQVATLLDHDRYVSALVRRLLRRRFDRRPARARDRHEPGRAGRSAVALGARLRQTRRGRARREHPRRPSTNMSATPSSSAPDRSGKSTTLHIVGTATMPAIGANGNHPTMGTGALLDEQLIPPGQRNQQQSTIPGPQAVLIRIAKNAPPAAALHSLDAIVNTLNKSPDGPISGLTGVLRPAEIVNYRTTGSTPAFLGAALAVGALTALALTLTASARRRRHELALLKTLGFTRRTTRSNRGLAINDRRHDRRHHRHPARHPPRTNPLGPLRPSDPRRARTNRPRAHHHTHRRRRTHPRQPRRRNPRTPSRPNAKRAPTTRRLNPRHLVRPRNPGRPQRRAPIRRPKDPRTCHGCAVPGYQGTAAFEARETLGALRCRRTADAVGPQSVLSTTRNDEKHWIAARALSPGQKPFRDESADARAACKSSTSTTTSSRLRPLTRVVRPDPRWTVGRISRSR